MIGHGSQSADMRLVGPPVPSNADELRKLIGNGNLPTDRDAASARSLARQQRALRDAVSETAVALARGVRPSADDTIGQLALEQESIATAIQKLDDRKAQSKEPPLRTHIQDAIKSARRAVEQLQDGSVNSAIELAAQVEASLRSFSGSDSAPDAAAGARELARKQAALLEKLKNLKANPTAEATRQHKRQIELASETARLSDAMRDTADTTADSPIGRAGTATRNAHEEMTKAAQNAATGRAQLAAEARARAGEQLARAVSDAAQATGARPAPTSTDRDTLTAGSAVRRAGDQMRLADSHQGKPIGNLGNPMRQAAEALTLATEALNRLLGGQQAPTGPDTTDKSPRPEIPLPADINQFDKPWGQLPGDVRSKYLQDIAAKYGDDYARAIKLYFESLAEQK
jgi:hypothetical protein